MLYKRSVRISFGQLNRTAPIRSVVIFYGVVTFAFVSVYIRKTELVDYRVAVLFGIRKGFVVETVAQLFGKVGVARRVHSSRSILGGIALSRKQIVHRFVSVLRRNKVIIAVHRNVCTRAESIVRREIFLVHFDRNRLRLPRGNFARLAEVYKLHARHLYAVFYRVRSVGLRHVNLHGGFARVPAFVFNVYRHGIALARLRNSHIREREVGVGKPVTERIRHHVAVIVFPYFFRPGHIIFISGFGVFIAKIHTFLINGIGSEGGLILIVERGIAEPEIGVIRVRKEIVLVHKVAVYGVFQVVVPQRSRYAAAEIVFARQKLRNGNRSHFAYRTRKQARVHSVSIFFKKIQLYGACHIQDKYYFLYFFLLFKLLQPRKHGLFGGAQLQIVAVSTVVGRRYGVILVAVLRVFTAGCGQVVAFAARSFNHVNRRVAVLLHVRVARTRLNGFPGHVAYVYLARTARRIIFGVVRSSTAPPAAATRSARPCRVISRKLFVYVE